MDDLVREAKGGPEYVLRTTSMKLLFNPGLFHATPLQRHLYRLTGGR